jgi:hypothetical protein
MQLVTRREDFGIPAANVLGGFTTRLELLRKLDDMKLS